MYCTSMSRGIIQCFVLAVPLKINSAHSTNINQSNFCRFRCRCHNSTREFNDHIEWNGHCTKKTARKFEGKITFTCE